MAIKLPAISAAVPVAIRKPLEDLRSALQKVLSTPDLVSLGLIEQSGTGWVPVSSGGIAPTYQTSAAITGLAASGAFASIILSWDDPSAQVGFAHTNVYRASVDDIGLSIKIGATSAPLFSDIPPNSSTSVMYYYWVRGVNKNGVEGAYNQTAGTAGSTANDPAYVMDMLLGKLGFDQFSSGSFPVRSEVALPTLPHTKYPIGVLVYLTTDGKLYRNVADVWTSEVAAVDVQGQIAGTQISDGAISTPKILTNAITAGKISAGAIVAGDGVISNLAIGNAHIINGTITNAKIAALAVDNAKVSSLSAAKITFGSMSGDRIAVNTLNGNRVIANTIDVVALRAGTVSVAVELTSPIVRYGNRHTTQA